MRPSAPRIEPPTSASVPATSTGPAPLPPQRQPTAWEIENAQAVLRLFYPNG